MHCLFLCEFLQIYNYDGWGWLLRLFNVAGPVNIWEGICPINLGLMVSEDQITKLMIVING